MFTAGQPRNEWKAVRKQFKVLLSTDTALATWPYIQKRRGCLAGVGNLGLVLMAKAKV